MDHTFLFTGAVQRIQQMVEEGTLGKLYYYDSTRVNLGLFQHDVNVIWDLAPHDLSIVDHLTADEARSTSSHTAKSHLNGLEDLAYITVYYSDRMIAHINVNWLSPVKVRTTLIGGEKKCSSGTILRRTKSSSFTIRRARSPTARSIYDLLVSYRSGDMWAPQVDEDRGTAPPKPNISPMRLEK